ncbi:hypothetical protein AB0F17_29540 [Nonomuraea sp. NPDC026600]|uniref:hypothetical protein n=1 Tax=Nonomuraea sp. NPDC026600 TaxID=3155363 RepID=UPI0033D4C441
MTTTFLCLAALVVGCGWLQGTVRVDPAILVEVRAIGTVSGESEMQSDVNGRAEITNFLVIDIGVADSRDAVEKAVKKLQAQEWVIEAENKPVRVLMKSNRWAGAQLSITPYDPINLHDVPDLQKALAGKAPKEKGLVIIDVFNVT